MKNIPIYMINLKKDIEKKDHMQKLCKKYNLAPEFIEAVDGKPLSEEDVAKVYSSEETIKKIDRELSRGELGCALSHKCIYQRMIDENIPEAVILEDDIEFNSKLINLLQLKQHFPKNTELVLLGYWHTAVKDSNLLISFRKQFRISNKYKFVRFTQAMHGTYGYYITLEGAKKLLHTLKEKINMPIDHYTNDDKYINLYGVYPSVIKLSNSFDINTDLEKERESLRQRHNDDNVKFQKTKFILNKLHILEVVRYIKNNVPYFIDKMKQVKEYS